MEVNVHEKQIEIELYRCWFTTAPSIQCVISEFEFPMLQSYCSPYGSYVSTYQRQFTQECTWDSVVEVLFEIAA